MIEAVLRGSAATTLDQLASRWSNRADNAQSDRAVDCDLQSGSAAELDGGPDRQAGHSQTRRIVTLTVVAVLLVGFVVIVTWGLVHSDWLYGTYGGIRQTDWDEISRVRRELVHLGSAPGAVAALDDALLVPRPSTEDVLYDLQKAVLFLQTGEFTSDTQRLLADLQALLREIQPGYIAPSTDRPTPLSDISDSIFPQE
jgi:hypothetical protein